MPEVRGQTIAFTVNGQRASASEGTSVAAALMNQNITCFRRSVDDAKRGPLCGMGVCFECRVTIDGVSQSRSCLMPVREGMEVRTDE